MSSYSGEIGLIYRTAYCASKFAVTGFFESLRMEIGDLVDVTIICPITVETNLRKHALMFKHNTTQEDKLATQEIQSTSAEKAKMSTSAAVDTIMLAVDTRMRKVFFPW